MERSKDKQNDSGNLRVFYLNRQRLIQFLKGILLVEGPDFVSD